MNLVGTTLGRFQVIEELGRGDGFIRQAVGDCDDGNPRFETSLQYVAADTLVAATKAAAMDRYQHRRWLVRLGKPHVHDVAIMGTVFYISVCRGHARLARSPMVSV